MRSTPSPRTWLLLVALALPCAAAAQSFAADYALTRRLPSGFEADLTPRTAALALGALRVAPAFSAGGAGAGLSVEAGKLWFGRVTLGRHLDAELLMLAGGYRWREGETLSMQLTRSRGQERLGLALRYDWPRHYVRIGLDPRPGDGALDMLRFSAGMRF